MNRVFCLCVAASVWMSVPLNIKAQNLDSIQKAYPKEKAVMLNHVFQYNISLKDNQPYVESQEDQQIEYVTGTANTYTSQNGFSHSDFQQLITYDAFTQTPDNKKLKVTDFKTSIDKESFVFYDDVKQTTFNFPSIGPGAIGNLHVSWVNKEAHLLSPYFFSSSIPVINSELKVDVSKDINIKYHLVGLDTSQITVNIEKKHRDLIYTFQYKNCPPDKYYSDSPGFSWYSPHVIVYIDSYTDKSGNKVSFLSNDDDLYRVSYGYLKDINKQITPELKHIVDSLTAGATSQEAKAKAIYSWVQGNIKYVAFEDGMGGFVPRDAGLVCSRRFGDCKDMASILTEMLNSAGVTAYFTWIGTRELPYDFTKVALPLVSDHMICTILLDGKYIFLDGTDPTCVFGMPSSMIQDKQAMISINEKEYKILTVPVIPKERNTISDTTWLEMTPTGLKGKIKRTLTGYYASDIYGKLLYWDKKNIMEDVKDEFERGTNKFHLDTFYIDKKQPTNVIVLSGEFSLPDYAKSIGGDTYVNLNLFRFFEGERIDYPERKVPVSYNFLSQRTYVTMLKIPDGYKLTYLPTGKSFHNDVFGFDIKYEQKGNWVSMTQQFANDNLLLTADKFQAWNKVLQNLFPLYKETLSLSKN